METITGLLALCLIDVEVHRQAVSTVVDVGRADAFGATAAETASLGLENHEHFLRCHDAFACTRPF